MRELHVGNEVYVLTEDKLLLHLHDNTVTAVTDLDVYVACTLNPTMAGPIMGLAKEAGVC